MNEQKIDIKGRDVDSQVSGGDITHGSRYSPKHIALLVSGFLGLCALASYAVYAIQSDDPEPPPGIEQPE